jgi:DNA polymerase III gamma/tau subunit
MIPLMLITDDKKQIKKYLKTITKEGDLFFEITPLTSEYSINEVKEVIKETKIYFKQKRIYLFPNFHLSSLEAQNTFLKVLEEPASNVQFILTTNNPNSMLSTIRSRAKIINLENKPVLELEKDIETALITLIEEKKLNILSDLKFLAKTKDEGLKILDQIILFFKERLSTDRYSPLILKEILKKKSLMESNNLNPQLTIDHILIFVGKTYSMK